MTPSPSLTGALRRIASLATYLAWAVAFWVRVRLLRQERAFIAGFVLNESCNLRCKQCRSPGRDLPDPTADEVLEGLRALAARGIRNLAIEGGEPFLWRDRERDLEWVVAQARELGFKAIAVYTNGTLPLRTSADVVFVSVDGVGEVHDRLRGCSYERAMANIDARTHPNVFVNATLNSVNADSIAPFLTEMERHPGIRKVFFFLHTPYYGRDELYLPADRRQAVLEEVLRLKRSGRRIANSTACLRGVLRGEWRGPSSLCCVWTRGKIIRCCRAIDTPGVCADCGYLGYPELDYILKLRPSALWEALGYVSIRRSAR